MTKPVVTIGIPVYNVEKFVEKSLRSVLGQDYEFIEILVVYDKSDDNSLLVVKKLLENGSVPYTIIINKKENKGLGKARNVILDNFSGDFLFFLDSDDYLEPLSISLFMNEALSNGADVVVGSHQSVDGDHNVLEKFRFGHKKTLENKSLKDHIYVENKFYPIYTWNKLYEKSFLKKNNLRYIHNDVEDALFSFQAIENAEKVTFLPTITLSYLIRETSLTRAPFQHSRANIFISICDYIYNYHKGSTSFSSLCCKVDWFYTTYVMIFRDAYKSQCISKRQKEVLYKLALKTPRLPVKHLKKILFVKKNKTVLLILVKTIPFRLNVFLIHLYHLVKSKKC